MSCFRCFSSAEKPKAQPPRLNPQAQASAKPENPPRNEQPAAENGSVQSASKPETTAAGNSRPQYIYPKAELDPQNARYVPIAARSKGEPREPELPSKIPRVSPQGKKTPAFMAIPPLGSPLNNGSSPRKHSKSQSAGRVVNARPLLEDLPPLKSTQSVQESPPPSFKGFPTGKEREIALAALDTSDIWKPRISETPPPIHTVAPSWRERRHSSGSGGQTRVTTPSMEGSVPEANGLERSPSKSGDAVGDEWAKSLRGSQSTPMASRRLSSKASSRVKGSMDGLLPATPTSIHPIRTPGQKTPQRTSSAGSGSLNGETVRELESGATPTGLHQTKSGSLSGTPTESGQVGGELYELVSQLGVGDTGVTKLMRDRRTGELVATKWVPHMAGEMLSVKVEREILNHRKLLHPNVVRFREVFATEEHLVIVTDYAAAGNLADRVEDGGAVPEARGKEYFRQLVDGMVYCHKLGIVHRNLRLEKLLLDGPSTSPIVKISGFAYSKAPDLDSAPKSIIGGGPDFMAPELLAGSMNGMDGGTYDGRAMDVWSIGVSLFTIVCGSLPFKDSDEPGIMSQRLLRRIVTCQYDFPPNLHLSAECKDLISKILTANPSDRIDSYAIQHHPWMVGTSLPKTAPVVISQQSESDISLIMERARRRKEARIQKERAQRGRDFNEDMIHD